MNLTKYNKKQFSRQQFNESVQKVCLKSSVQVRLKAQIQKFVSKDSYQKFVPKDSVQKIQFKRFVKKKLFFGSEEK
ncbi:MAG: hypothetical protein ACRDAS_08100 [Cetobacterium sp.]